jgi:GTP pyrophosphokinase
VIDFAYAIHSNVGDQAVAVKINGEHVPLRTELNNGDVIEVKTNALSSPNPGWLGFVRTARARAKIRQYLKTLNQADSQKLGQKMLAQALRSEGFDHVPDDQGINATIWEKLLHFSGNRTSADLLTEIGVGRRIASIVAKRLAKLLQDSGERPNALLLSCERFANGDTISQGNVTIDGSENTSVRFAICCRPIPGDGILGYLGRGECLAIHTKGCHVAHKLQHKESDRFIPVEWSDEPVRSFETSIVVTVHNNKGVFAKVATSLAAAEADINHVDMTDTTTHATVNMTFVISVRDRLQLDMVFKNLRHTACVVSARRNNNAL